MTQGRPDLTGLHNVALGKPATQSSIFEARPRHAASGAVNGAKTGGYGFHTASEPEPWWRLDLLAPVPVRFVVLWNREDAAPERVRNLIAEASGDGESWTVLHRTGDAIFGGVRSGTPLMIACDDRPFRFLRLRRTEPGYLHLDEVEVFSTQAPEPPADSARKEFLALWHEMGERAESTLRVGRDGMSVRWPRPEPCPGSQRTISIRRGGRFGNNIIQLVQAIHVARHAGIRRIHLDAVNPAGLATPRRIEGIEFVPHAADGTEGPDFQGYFFYRHALPRCYEKLTVAETASIVETFIRPMFDGFFPEPPRSTSPTLHIHLRGGDIFVRPHLLYTQPPLAFYRLVVQRAVAEFGVRAVVLVHEDEANPCLAGLRAWLDAQGIDCRSQSASVREDVGELMAAEHLVVSRGTFAVPAMLLSTRLRTVFGFRRDAVTWEMGLPTAVLLAHRGIRLLNVEDTAAAYTPDDRWQNTPEQRAMMLDYPEASLRLVEAGEDHTRP